MGEHWSSDSSAVGAQHIPNEKNHNYEVAASDCFQGTVIAQQHM